MGHEVNDALSLELAARVVARLHREPSLQAIAHQNLNRWEIQNADAPGLMRCYAEWRSILARPVEEISRILLAQTDEGQRLRQNSPFAGILSPREVWELKKGFRHAATPA